ncbi:MAG: penicillin acylase family protein, partial [Planctomycetes bacterium]|nr:penicillin acylase family protein [Planctomycetota bacterium]
MGLTRALFRLILGKRPAVTEGSIRLEGIREEVEILRDRWGIPHIRAANDADAWFAAGFCQGQDRSFQIETLQRLGRGTLAALVGPDALP